MREHKAIRGQVHAGIAALRVQGRQIWGADKLPLDDIIVRLMVGVGDLARLSRDGAPQIHPDNTKFDVIVAEEQAARWDTELKKELGNVLFSTIRWIDDLGLDVMECLDLAIQAQEKFAKSGRPR